MPHGLLLILPQYCIQSPTQPLELVPGTTCHNQQAKLASIFQRSKKLIITNVQACCARRAEGPREAAGHHRDPAGHWASYLLVLPPRCRLPHLWLRRRTPPRRSFLAASWPRVRRRGGAAVPTPCPHPRPAMASSACQEMHGGHGGRHGRLRG